MSTEPLVKLPAGLYEHLINEFIDAGIAEATRDNLRAELRHLDPGDSHTYLAHYLAGHIRKAFASLPETERLSRQIELANKVIVLLANTVPGVIDPGQARLLRAELLLGILRAPVGRPDTPLSASCLMTGTRQDPSLVSQLRKEFLSADRVDILCSFIKWGGVRILEESLRKHTDVGLPLRVITTSYMGATDLKAVEFLRSLPHTELRVSYDTRRTRLHAKAYIFHRQTGFGVAYIGSSNLSQAALTEGLEWNVKISQHESPHLWAKVCATFDTYWNDDEFVPYELRSRERLREALEQERGGADVAEIRTVFDIKPYPFQQEILDKLAAERVVHGRFRNLVVAATGTGKTVISAFDYARFRRQQENAGQSRRARLLFVAHREEILKQSLACFRMVLRDHNFGDLLVGDFEPQGLEHLFISIQSFNFRALWDRIAPDFYDFVVLDEFHHAAAPSYRKLLDFVQPQVLLGLTATPERMDALDVIGFFGGHIAAEIRLPDAISRKLLCPFQYFGITDAVDYSNLRWQRGGYVIEDLDRLVTGNDVRARLIISKVQEILLEVRKARGLGFCVSIRHAEYMAAVFSRAGIPAIALSANSPDDLRRLAQRKLISREANFIFVVDLYNEGVDIPEVDTILLLRPTESLTVFLQQLGRGLRLHEDKECLTILDFIGQAHQNFNFEARFRALIGQTSRRIEEEIEQGLPHLPAGCVVNLERIAARHILDNIREATAYNRSRLVRRIGSYQLETGKPLTLRDFVEYHRLALDDIYQRDSWSRLLVQAGIRPDFNEPDEERLAKGLRRLAHVNAVNQLRSLLATLPAQASSGFREPEDETARRFLLMLHFTLWTREWSPGTLAESVRRLCANRTMFVELRELLTCNLERVEEVPDELSMPFPCPLQLHADYTRDEILAGLGVWTLESQREVREGVLYVENLPADLFFTTLNKTESDYSPTTMYDDYAIGDELFHWQSQSTTSADSPTGQRYIRHLERGNSVLLFVREDKRRNGLAMPYTFLGPVEYVRHEGSRPMSIVWRLRHKLPARLMRHIRRLANY
jgi:superfamily II DNA or RNA helicase/HKD family nuclease